MGVCVWGVYGWRLQGGGKSEKCFTQSWMWLGGVTAPLMIEGQRKKAHVGGEQLEVREEAAEYRSTGKNARKDQNPETESGPSTDCSFCTRQPRQVVRTATCEKEKPVFLSGIKTPGCQCPQKLKTLL